MSNIGLQDICISGGLITLRLMEMNLDNQMRFSQAAAGTVVVSVVVIIRADHVNNSCFPRISLYDYVEYDKLF